MFKFIIATIIALLLSVATGVQASVTWEMRVHQSNFDVEGHALNDQEFKPYLAQTSWRCWAEKPSKNVGKLEIRALNCNYSVEATGAFRAVASCGPNKVVDEIAIDLKDERKNLELKVILSCRFVESTKP